jgi:hypothetical protein
MLIIRPGILALLAITTVVLAAPLFVLSAFRAIQRIEPWDGDLGGESSHSNSEVSHA